MQKTVQNTTDRPLRAAESLTGLELYRFDLGLSQSEAARVVGVSRRQLARLEADPQMTAAAIRVALMYVAVRVIIGAPPLLAVSNGNEAA